MGACVSCQRGVIAKSDGYPVGKMDRNVEDEHEGIAGRGDYGARIRLHGSSIFTSMYSKQGRKGINQDSMTVWEARTYTHTYIHTFSIYLMFVGYYFSHPICMHFQKS